MSMWETWCNFIIELVTLTTQVSMATGMKRYADREEDFSAMQKNILKQLPTSLYTALNALHLDSETTLYVVCPACSFCHRPDAHAISPNSLYPTNCTQLIPGDSGLVCCSAGLLEQCHGGVRPKKPFLLASLPDYLTKSLSNPDIEKLCNQACDDALAQRNAPSTSRTMMGVFDGGFLRDFIGPDGKLFIDRGDKV
ncbi:uncharacterized protein EV420DRAFT_1649876 [Desarmillaria tabescens]|uniref:Uncharacterized protein n=1 Tax=Armillaria tabescens TaxID=1929756 RepID=A0AA39JG32_ARMTA|nr:uncharacterized protein EV420DRAFT_1649876 [Desarmillaria tabescens]KAK0441764.1 hypothetical protein EV420DRAFT_1649876 [Desarmillaria tabescens]